MRLSDNVYVKHVDYVNSVIEQQIRSESMSLENALLAYKDRCVCFHLGIIRIRIPYFGLQRRAKGTKLTHQVFIEISLDRDGRVHCMILSRNEFEVKP